MSSAFDDSQVTPPGPGIEDGNSGIAPTAAGPARTEADEIETETEQAAAGGAEGYRAGAAETAGAEAGAGGAAGAEAGAGGAAGAEAGAGGAAGAEAGAGEAEVGEPTDGTASGMAYDDPFRLDLSRDLVGLEALLSDDFARISAERDEYLDALQRLQADFDNHRKRLERQLAESRERANQALLLRLLPVLDALDLAMAHLRPDDSAGEAASSLVQIHTLLRDTLAREGLERIDSVGVPFDPTIHDATAIDESEADDNEAGGPAGPAVTEVWRPGYRMRDRVIRPAMVRVRG
jgi:molecular chaperone GrpE